MFHVGCLNYVFNEFGFGVCYYIFYFIHLFIYLALVRMYFICFSSDVLHKENGILEK